MKAVFLDTNVVLDLLDDVRANHKPTKQLMKAIVEQGHCVVISEDMLSTVYYITKNKQAVLAFTQWILDQWRVVPFGKKVVKQAIELCQHHPKQDFEDALQCFCAKENGCDLLITNDVGFVECGIKIISVKKFLENP